MTGLRNGNGEGKGNAGRQVNNPRSAKTGKRGHQRQHKRNSRAEGRGRAVYIRDGVGDNWLIATAGDMEFE
jgi:hypothetical protein